MVRPRTVAVVLGIIFGALFVLSLGYLAWHAITWVFIAHFLAMALNPVVDVLRAPWFAPFVRGRRHLFLALVAIAALAFASPPPLAREVVAFVEAVPDLIRELDQGRGPLGFIEREFRLVDRAEEALADGGAAGALGFASRRSV